MNISENRPITSISKFISNFFNPFTSLVLYFIYYSYKNYDVQESLYRFLPIFLIIILPTSAWIFYNVKAGKYQNLDVSNRIQRKTLYIFVNAAITLYLLYDYLVMITAKGELPDKEKAYSSGTDDYIVKPFEPKEVLFRIKALLRRFQMINEDIIKVGKMKVNLQNYEVESNGKKVILPLKEFELLAQLANFPDRIFTREQLIDHVWGMDFTGNDRTVDVHIKRLRERFNAEDDHIAIETVRGIGYKLKEIKSN